MNNVYLIFNDKKLDLKEVKGVIVGNEEQAEQYCNEYNSECKDSQDEIWYEELKVLNEESEEEIGEWISVGDWILVCSKCDGEIEDKDTDEYPAFCPWCGKPMKKEVRR